MVILPCCTLLLHLIPRQSASIHEPVAPLNNENHKERKGRERTAPNEAKQLLRVAMRRAKEELKRSAPSAPLLEEIHCAWG